ncbi:MAG: alpha/beta hydrolase [Saprospiraceae bacterium]|nr:alpha/beta hydrolase [Saprospiraceae bacterium]
MLIKFLKYTGITLLVLIVGICFFYWENDIPLETLKTRYASKSSAFVDVMQMKVHYRDEGFKNDSVPLVLIHGTGASLHTWEESVNLLKDSFRIITMDLPAYGLTGPNPERVYSQEFYVQFIHEFLTSIHVDKCIIGGNSLGGAIAWNYAYQYPEKVKKLILIDAAGYPMVSESKPIAFTLAQIPILKHLLNYVTPRFLAEKSVINVYEDPSKVTDKLVDRYYELFLREGNRQAFVDRMNFSEYPGYLEKIRGIQIPALILWGANDKLIPVENALKFQNDLLYNSLVILEKTGHVPMEEAPERTVAEIRSFLK